MSLTTSKTCSKCNNDYLLDHYYFDKKLQKHRGWCKSCNKTFQDYYRSKHREKAKNYSKEYALKNKTIVTEKRLERYKNNREYIGNLVRVWKAKKLLEDPLYFKKRQKTYPRDKDKLKIYYDKNKETIRIKKQSEYIKNRNKYLLLAKQNRNNNPKREAFYRAEKRARKRNATPLWANKELIKSFYRNTPVNCVVDHVVPLKGKIVSGLHVENNLQYLTFSQNAKKYNNFEG